MSSGYNLMPHTSFGADQTVTFGAKAVVTKREILRPSVDERPKKWSCQRKMQCAYVEMLAKVFIVVATINYVVHVANA